MSAGLDGILGGLLVAGAIVGYVAFARSKSRYIVTDERVKMDIGFINGASREYRISDVQGIDTSQSLIGKLFSIGDIAVRTADGTEIPWRGVPDHEQVAHTIREHQRKYDQTMDRK
ncbi:PH domain-containing protein [Natrialba magadii]|nr:PH domain-containing protein [Natrialba magadii]